MVCRLPCSSGGRAQLNVPVTSLECSLLEAPCKENPIDGPPLPSCLCMSSTWDCPAKTLLSGTELEGAPGTFDLGLAPVCSHSFAQLELVPFMPTNNAKIKVEYSNTNWSLWSFHKTFFYYVHYTYVCWSEKMLPINSLNQIHISHKQCITNVNIWNILRDAHKTKITEGDA